MAWMAKDSAIRVPRDMEERMQLMTTEEIKQTMHDLAVSQALVKKDLIDPTVLLPTVRADAAPRVSKTITLNGVQHTLTSETESDLLAQENALYRQNLEPAATTQQTEQPARDAATGRFTAQQTPTISAEDKAALQLQFQLGQIDVQTYLEKSNAMADYLEKAGIPLDILQETVAEKRSERSVASWEQATEEFLHSSAGADWPGGENMNILGRLIQENELVDQPSAETLARVWDHMKQHGLAVETPEAAAHKREVETQQRVRAARDFESIRTIVGANHSDLWGRG